MKRIILLFAALITSACWPRPEAYIAAPAAGPCTDNCYVLAEFIQRNDAANSLDAQTDWMLLPEGRHWWLGEYSRDDCKEVLDSVLYNEMGKFNRFISCEINDNIAICDKERHEFHCMPLSVWKGLKIPDDFYKTDLGIIKDPDEFSKIQNCADYKTDSLFVCEK